MCLNVLVVVPCVSEYIGQVVYAHLMFVAGSDNVCEQDLRAGEEHSAATGFTAQHTGVCWTH